MKKLFYLLLALPLISMACKETPDAPTPDVKEPILTLTSESEMVFTVVGPGEITYTLENPQEGLELTATCEDQWINDIVVGQKITFYVEYPVPWLPEDDQTVIKVAYGEESFEVIVKRVANKNDDPDPSSDVQFEASYFTGQYYGDYYGPQSGNYYLHFSDNGFNEAGNSYPNSKYYILDLYGPLFEGDRCDNIPLPVGTYMLDADDTMAQWTLGLSYSGYKETDAEGNAKDVYEYESGELVVTEEGATLTVVINKVKHVVTFSGKPTITDNRVEKTEDVQFNADKAWAYYFGDIYNKDVADNFYVFFSDKGVDEDHYELAGATYYRFDIYTELIDKEAGIAVPYGTYLLDATNSNSVGTFSYSLSLYYVMDDYAMEYAATAYITSGYITFSEQGVKAEININGVKHVINYDGALEYFDESETEDPGVDPGDNPGDDTKQYSTLKADYTCCLDDHTLYYVYYGDYYEVGYRNWTFALMPNSGVGDFVKFDVLTSMTNYTDFFGEFTIADTYKGYTAFSGYIDGYLEGSWYYTDDGVTMAPFMEGTLKVEDAGSGKATVTFSVKDDKGYTVSGEWTGEMINAE